MMSPAKLQHLCPNCFNDKSEATVCPQCGFDENKRDAIALPYRTLLSGRYLSGRVLGSGGFGITYVAWDTRLDIRVAIKEYLPRDFAERDGASLVVRPRAGGENEQDFKHWLDSFLKEAKSVACFKHPNIVRVSDLFDETGTAYLVMDYLEGASLDEYLLRQRTPLSVAHSLEIMLPVLDGLAQVHGKGMVHRDIKPQNIYLTTDGKAILLDFGAARPNSSECSKLTAVWTAGYAPPEQYTPQGQGPWSDIYACAAVLYYMTTGVKPQPSDLRNVSDSLCDPRKIIPSLSPEFAEALLQGLVLEPQQRPPDIASFLQALKPPLARPEPTYFGIEMLPMSAGEFEMGSADNDKEAMDDEKPRHMVKVRALKLGKTQVTQRQWQAIMGSNPSNFKQCGDDCPVENVSYDDVQEFIQQLNAQTGRVYRLPTEAEWEYACREGRYDRYSGSDDLNAVAWYSENSGKTTHPVGQKQPNAWGLYDMSGNVWEWTCSAYRRYEDKENTNPNEANISRTVRGGSWNNTPFLVRSAYRLRFVTNERTNNIGFRLAQD